MTLEDIQELDSADMKDSLMVKKPLVGNVFVSYKTTLGFLSSWFLITDELKRIETAIGGFQTNFDSIIGKFVPEDYMETHDYMLKEDADISRKKLLTDEKIDAILDEFITKNQLSIDLKEVEENSYALANSYVATMIGPATTIKSGLGNQNGFETVTDAIGEINITTGGGD